jgi:hypothetical protein
MYKSTKVTPFLVTVFNTLKSVDRILKFSHKVTGVKILPANINSLQQIKVLKNALFFEKKQIKLDFAKKFLYNS